MRNFCALPAMPALIRVSLRQFFLEAWMAFRNLTQPEPVTEESPVFVVGCGHSGTTLVVSILNAHPRIEPFPGEANNIHPRNSYAEVAEWYRTEREKLANGQRLAEKTASNVRYLRRIFALFPHAQVVVVTRDGRDVACSLRERTGRLPGAIVRWLNDTKRGLAWRKDDRVHQMRYEDLVTDFDQATEDLCRFLGIDYRPELRDFHEAGYRYAADKTAEKAIEHGERREAQARSPLFDGRGRWRGCFSDRELCQFQAVAARRMRELGYGEA